VRAFAATNEPDTCRWCGRKLRWKCHTAWEDADSPPRRCRHEESVGNYARVRCDSRTFERPEEGTRFWRCSKGHDNGPRRQIAHRERRYKAPGAYGDGFFCGLDCGFAFGVSMARLGRMLKPVA
jgi:hypothetical protein